MTDCTLYRYNSDEQGTLGKLFIFQDWFVCYTLELPWRDNEPFLSCIPAGTYPIAPYESSKFGSTYLIQEVPGRTGILFHSGNVAGDKHKDYRTHSAGCILPGKKRGILWRQKAVLVSRTTTRKLKEALDDREGEIEITDGWR